MNSLAAYECAGPSGVDPMSVDGTRYRSGGSVPMAAVHPPEPFFFGALGNDWNGAEPVEDVVLPRAFSAPRTDRPASCGIHEPSGCVASDLDEH